MKDDTNVPEPEETGIEGSQKKEYASINPENPLNKLPLARTITGLAASRPQQLGGQMMSAMLAGATHQMAQELFDLKKEIEQCREKNSQLTEQFYGCREEKQILSTKLENEKTTRKIRSVAITAGTLLIPFSIELHRSNMTDMALVSGTIGLFLLLFGWSWLPIQKGNQS